jgi:hypothetical protein
MTSLRGEVQEHTRSAPIAATFGLTICCRPPSLHRAAESASVASGHFYLADEGRQSKDG